MTELKPEHQQALQRAWELQRNGQLDQAERVCQNILNQEGQVPQARFINAIVEAKRSNVERTIELATKAIELDASQPEFNLLL